MSDSSQPTPTAKPAATGNTYSELVPDGYTISLVTDPEIADPGWYFHETEYPDAGAVGPYDSEPNALIALLTLNASDDHMNGCADAFLAMCEMYAVDVTDPDTALADLLTVSRPPAPVVPHECQRALALFKLLEIWTARMAEIHVHKAEPMAVGGTAGYTVRAVLALLRRYRDARIVLITGRAELYTHPMDRRVMIATPDQVVIAERFDLVLFDEDIEPMACIASDWYVEYIHARVTAEHRCVLMSDGVPIDSETLPVFDDWQRPQPLPGFTVYIDALGWDALDAHAKALDIEQSIRDAIGRLTHAGTQVNRTAQAMLATLEPFCPEPAPEISAYLQAAIDDDDKLSVETPSKCASCMAFDRPDEDGRAGCRAPGGPNVMWQGYNDERHADCPLADGPVLLMIEQR